MDPISSFAAFNSAISFRNLLFDKSSKDNFNFLTPALIPTAATNFIKGSTIIKPTSGVNLPCIKPPKTITLTTASTGIPASNIAISCSVNSPLVILSYSPSSICSGSVYCGGCSQGELPGVSVKDCPGIGASNSLYGASVKLSLFFILSYLFLIVFSLC